MKRLIAPLIGLLAALHGPAWGQDSPQLQLPRVTLSAGMHLIQAQVASTPEQRATVLAAFDKALPELRGLQAERTALQAQLQSLSPKQPDYATRSDALAKQWGALHEREVLAYARFESAVAGALDDRQWGRWREFSSEMRFVGRGFDDGGMERRRR